MKNNSTLYKAIENKTIVWFEKNNKYVILENTTADILKRLQKKISVKEIAAVVSQKLKVTIEQTIDLILELERNFFTEEPSKDSDLGNDFRDLKRPTSFEYIKFYRINNIK